MQLEPVMPQFTPLAVTIHACATELDHCMVHFGTYVN